MGSLSALIVFALLSETAVAPVLPSVDQPPPGDVPRNRDLALVVGLERYENLPSVPFAQQDAEAIFDLVTGAMGLDPQNTVWLRAGRRSDILVVLDALIGRAEPGANLWIYFAGHATLSKPDGDRLLLAQDAPRRASELPAGAVALSEIEQQLRAADVRASLILDASMAGPSRSGVSLYPTARCLASGRPMESLRFLSLWSAARGTQSAGVLDTSGHGMFTYFLLGATRGWADGALDSVRDGRVTLAEATSYVKQMVSFASGGAQVPQSTLPEPLLQRSIGSAAEEAPDVELFRTAATDLVLARTKSREAKKRLAAVEREQTVR